MQVAKVQSNQQTFGTTVKFKPKTVDFLRRKGESMYYMYDCHANWMKADGHKCTMIISHTRRPHRKTQLVAELYVQKGGDVFVSESPVQEPLYTRDKDGNLIIARLEKMRYDLEQKLVKLKDLNYDYRLFSGSKKN